MPLLPKSVDHRARTQSTGSYGGSPMAASPSVGSRSASESLQREKLRIKKKFRQLDSNNDGVLTLHELRDLLQAGNPNMSDDDIEVLFNQADMDKSGKVDFDEFLEFIFPPTASANLKEVEPEASPEWFEHALNGNLPAMKSLVKSGTSVCATDMRPTVQFPPQGGGMTAVMYAAIGDHTEIIKWLVGAKADLDAKDLVLGMTAVMLAAEEGNNMCLAALADACANINIPDDSGMTAVMMAAAEGHLPCLRVLHRHDASLDVQDSRGWTAAMLTTLNGKEDCLNYLGDANADLDLQTQDGLTALMLAVRKGDEMCTKALMEKKVDILTRNRLKNTAAMEAQLRDQYPCLKLVQKKNKATRLMGMFGGMGGAPKKKKDEEEVPEIVGSEEWFEAAWRGKKHDLQRMLTQGDPVNAAKDGWTAAMICAIRGHTESIEFLAEKGANLDAADDQGWTATMLAAHKGHACCLELLATRKANLDLKEKDGRTAAILSAKEGHKQCLRLLNAHGANLNERTAEGATAALLYFLEAEDTLRNVKVPLGQSVTSAPSIRVSSPASGDRAAGHSDADEAAGSCPASPSHSSAGGLKEEPEPVPGVWFRAARRGRTEVLEELVEKGIDIDAMDSTGCTALCIAASIGDESSLRFLIEHGANAELGEAFSGKTPLAHAASLGSSSSLKMLLDKADVHPDSRDATKRTPLMEAAAGGHDKCIRLLARRGAMIDSKDDDGNTPAMHAASGGHVKSLQVLAELGADLLIRKGAGKYRNVLHSVENKEGLEAARSVVSAFDWRSCMEAADPTEKVCDELKAASAKNIAVKYHVAGLHLTIWKEDDMWNTLNVREHDFVDNLAEVLHALLVASGTMKLTKEGKQALTILLDAGLMRAVNVHAKGQLKSVNEGVLDTLEEALNKRQTHLREVAEMTPKPDNLYPRWNRHSQKVTEKLDQRDAMPDKVWSWIEFLPDDCFERLECCLHAFRAMGTVHSTGTFASYLRKNELLNDSKLYAQAAAHVLTCYAELVVGPFDEFMTDLFGDRYKHAPVKKLPRIFTKMTGDIPDLADEAKASEDAQLRIAYFGLGDAVRGAVWANGAHEMIETVNHLKAMKRGNDLGSFEAWRIKNTHHEDAEEMTGGYRDVKVLGKFTAKKEKRGQFKMPISMIVEVQVIDSVYLDIKQYMHKAYAIDRGDFD